MEQTRLVLPSSFCHNPDCPDYGRVNHGNIRKFGRTKKGTQRCQCKTCGRTFVETKGTVFYGLHHSMNDILECPAQLAGRNSPASIHRVKGIKEETILEWLRRAAKHVEEIEALLLSNCQTRVQLDALWAYAGHKGEKGGILRRQTGEHSGGAQRLTLTRGCG